MNAEDTVAAETQNIGKYDFILYTTFKCIYLSKIIAFPCNVLTKNFTPKMFVISNSPRLMILSELRHRRAIVGKPGGVATGGVGGPVTPVNPGEPVYPVPTTKKPKAKKPNKGPKKSGPKKSGPKKSKPGKRPQKPNGPKKPKPPKGPKKDKKSKGSKKPKAKKTIKRRQ